MTKVTFQKAFRKMTDLKYCAKLIRKFWFRLCR